MFGGQSNSSGSQGSKNPYASSQASKSLSATFSSQSTATGSAWQNRGNNSIAGTSTFGSPGPTFGGSFTGSTGGFGAVATNQPTTGFGSFSTPSPANSGLEVASSSGWKNSTPGSFGLSSNKGSSSHVFGSSHATSTFAPASTQHTFKCRMCQSAFPSSEELKRHIKAEGHFDTSRIAPTSGSGSSGGNFSGGGGSSLGAHNLHLQSGSASAQFGGPGTSSSTGGPFSQPHVSPFGQSKGPRGTPSPFSGAGSGSAPPRSQQQPWTKGQANNSSQDARQQHSQESHAPPPHASALHGHQAHSALPRGYQSHGQQPHGQNPYAQLPPRSKETHGQSHLSSSAGAAGHFGSNQTQQSFGVSGGSRPQFGAGAALAHPFRGSRGIPALSSNTQTATAVPPRSTVALNSVPENTSTGSDDAASVSGDDGDRASDGDYAPTSASDGDNNYQGTADEDADGDEEEEEDDLNFSFSSQESGVGDGANSTHSSPMKGPGLGSPAAAARSRAEQVPQRALFDQSSSASNVPAPAQGGAVSSLMGFMKTSSKFPAAAAPTASHAPYAPSSGSSAHGSDIESTSSDGTDAMGTCEDMCPPEERQKRLNESDVHKLEIPHPEMTPGRPDYAFTMVKKFQRSSADHALQIPHLLRTPDALLRSIEYIENELMDRAAASVFDPRIGEAPTALFIYLFVWDRYRMVAKDFTLQQSVLPLTRVWVECHERMARWFILMDHKMQAADDFISAGHGQQNGEQLNNLLKTLHGYYFRSRTLADASTSSTPAAVIDMPNKAEFVCYFVIFQLGNGGEVSKYLQQLPDEVLNSEQVRFAIEVWGALKTQNYAKYFRLLRTRATLLQACLMHRYVGEVRLAALKKLTRSLNPPGTKPQEYLLRDLMRLFMFESVPEAAEFIEHCGLTLCPSSASGLSPEHVSSPDEDFVVLLSGQNIDHLLPRDKNDRAIPPSTSYLGEAIDRVKALKQGSSTSCYSIAEVCRGFATGGSKPFFAPAARISSAPSANTVKSAEFAVRVPMPKGASPATVPDSAASEAKKKLLAQGLGSGRGPKPSASPIPPITEDDVWGPAVLGNKKITPQGVIKTANESPVTASPFSSAAFGSTRDPSLPHFEKKGIIAQFKKKSSDSATDQRSGSFGTAASTNASTNSGPDSSSAWGKIPLGEPAVKESPAFAPSSLLASGPGAPASAQDSWRRAAPVPAARDAPKEGSFGGSSNNKGQDKGQKVSSFNAVASAFPTIPDPALPFDKLSTPSGALGNASSWTTPKVIDSVTTTTGKSSFFPAPTTATTATTTAPSALAAAIGAFNAPASTPAAGPSTEAVHSFISKNFTPGLNPNSAAFVPAAARKNTEDFAAPIDPVADPTTSAAVFKNKSPIEVEPVSTVDPAKLKAFQEKISRLESIRAQKSVLVNWRNQALRAKQQCLKRIAALYFLFWKQAHRRSLRARDAFLSDIKAIRLVDPLVQGLDGLNIFSGSSGEASANGSTSINMLKRKQAQSAETQRQLKAIAETEAQVRYSLLCDAASVGPSTSTTSATSAEVEAVQRSRGTKSLLEIVGRTLRAAKTCQLRSLLGLPVAETTLQTLASGEVAAGTSDGPVFRGALSFKIAFVSDCAVAGVACKHSASKPCSCGGMSTSLRAQLANERGYGYSTSSEVQDPSQPMSRAQLGKMKKRRGLLARALVTRDSSLRVVRVGLHSHALDASTTLQLSVLDSCGKGGIRLETIDPRPDLTSQVEAVSDLTGVQATVLVIHAFSAFAINAVLNRLLFCAQERIPVVVVLFRPHHPTQSVEEISKTDILHATDPSPTCQAVRKVLNELEMLMYPERPNWIQTVQACIVVSGTTQDSPAGAREVLRRALPLLAASALLTPAVTRVRPADWVLRQLHRAGTVEPVQSFCSSKELSEQQLRGLGHEALVSAIDRINSRLTSVASTLREILSTNQVHTGKFPPFDFLTGSGYLPGGVLNVSAVQHTTDLSTTESDLNLPSNWLEVSQLTHVAEVVDSLRFPGWSSSDSISAYQASLVQFPSGKIHREGTVCAGGFVAALENALNTAYTSGQVELLPTAIEAVLEGVIRERLDGLSESVLPAFLYLPLDKPGSLLELLQPAPALNSGETVFSAGVEGDGDTNSNVDDVSVPMSPGNSRYIEQSQYAQAFPTGFGRSLFAQFNRDSVCFSANSSPSTDHKTKRAFDTDFSDADEYARYHESASERRASDASVQSGSVNNVTDSAHKRTKYNGESEESTARFGIAYEKLFGESKSPAPSTPAVNVLSADPTTRALQNELSREQAAADRLTSMLQAALSPVRSPLVARASSTLGISAHSAHSAANTPVAQPRSDSKQALQDPMLFIEQCRRERERFDAAASVVTL